MSKNEYEAYEKIVREIRLDNGDAGFKLGSKLFYFPRRDIDFSQFFRADGKSVRVHCLPGQEMVQDTIREIVFDNPDYPMYCYRKK